jgi:DNA-binding FadR family transcriptional regulator
LAGHAAEFARRDLAFHRVLVEASGNSLFISVMDGCFQNLGERFTGETYQMASALIPAVLAEHAAICDAVARHRQPKVAKKATTFHLAQSRCNLERLLFAKL